jgi:[ribosomal protein S5]-alanine N-acetyltransferase
LSLAPPIAAKLAPDQPVLRTGRLILRPLAIDDAPIVQKLAGERDVASTTRLIPHPYPPGMAEQWIAALPELYQKAEMINWGVAMQGGPLLGTIRLTLNPVDNHAEMGYWIGKPFWNNGYCTEAARAVMVYGFDVLGLERIYANYLARNPASGRVLHKLGMQQEGLLRRHRRKFGRYEDLIVCGLLKTEYQKLKRLDAEKRREAVASDGQPQDDAPPAESSQPVN